MVSLLAFGRRRPATLHAMRASRRGLRYPYHCHSEMHRGLGMTTKKADRSEAARKAWRTRKARAAARNAARTRKARAKSSVS
jgi:hypothetical protein